MSTEVNVVNMRCGMGCLYCYETAVRRETGNAGATIDHEAIEAELERSCGKGGFSLFGGEPLLAPIADLERLWAYGLKRFKRNGVQTSGAEITEEHFRLFRKYRVTVGFSIDGPGHLNDARRYGNRGRTRAATGRAIGWIKRCLREKVPCSLIVTLHRLNAGPDRIGELCDWLRSLRAMGLRSVQAHLLELDWRAQEIALSADENVAAMLELLKVHREQARIGRLGRWALRHLAPRHAGRFIPPRLKIRELADMEGLLLDLRAHASCVWKQQCDPWTTTAVQGINADGSRTGCSRVAKDGRPWLPAERSMGMRQAALWMTEQADGGCRGCRFFLQCGGHCPGGAIGGDWRRRTVHCEVIFRLLEHLESDLVARGKTPLTQAPDLMDRIDRMVAAWTSPGPPARHHDVDHRDVDHVDLLDAGKAIATLEGGEVVR